MKNVLLAAAVTCAFAPTSFADSNQIRARLSGFQEVPVVSTTGTGRFRAEIISAVEVKWELTYEGMESPVTQAHIHIAQRNVNGGIVLWLCQSATNLAPPSVGFVADCTSPSGSFSGTFGPTSVTPVTTQHFAPPDLAEVMRFVQAGLAYANVHTVMSPGGEIRGQTRKGRGGHHHDHDD